MHKVLRNAFTAHLNLQVDCKMFNLQCAEGKFPHFLNVNSCDSCNAFSMKFGKNNHEYWKILLVKFYCYIPHSSNFMRQNLK